MHKATVVCLLSFLIPISGQEIFAQNTFTGQVAGKSQNESPGPSTSQVGHFYRLDFTVEEAGQDGKVTNSRVYSTNVGADAHGELMSIRTGSRVPIATGPYNASGKDNTQVATQFQYIDMGVNFDVRDVHEFGRQLSLNLTADLSGLAGNDPSTKQPIIRHNRWQGLCLIPTGKATVVFSADSLDSNGSTRILVTATRLE